MELTLRARTSLPQAFSVLIAVFMPLTLPKAAALETTAVTQPGESLAYGFPDSSEVRLHPDTTIEIRFDEKRRAFRVLRGAAVFRVATDHRPFSVEVGPAIVHSSGGEFGVRHETAGAAVTVLEGTVSVLPADPQPALESTVEDDSTQSARGGVQLSANEQVLVSSSGARPVKCVFAERELAWGYRLLVSEHWSIRDMANELNALNRLQIEIADPEIGDRPVRGGFRSDNPEGFVSFLQLRLPTIVTYPDDDTVRIELDTLRKKEMDPEDDDVTLHQ